MLDRRRPLSPRDDQRKRIARARQAADALFTTKRQLNKQPVADCLPSADQSVRKPRVLKALSPAPVGHEEGIASVESERPITPEIPKSQFARIRAWVKYGMAAAQVAAVYGVAVDVIGGILSDKADGSIHGQPRSALQRSKAAGQ